MVNQELARRTRAVWAPSLVRRVLRHRITSTLVMAAALIVAYSSVEHHTAALEAERMAWVDRREVLVVTEAVSAGELLESVVEVRDLPAVAIPPDALSALEAGSRAGVAMFEGDVVIAPRVAGAVGTGLESGTVAITIEVARPVQLVSPGDLVDLWSIGAGAGEAALVVEAVVVLAHNDQTFTLAVPASAAPVAAAAAFEQLVITRIG